MNERHEFIGNFLTEHYKVFVDGVETDNMSSGCWTNLEDIMNAAEKKITPGLPSGKRIVNRYINLHKLSICFWTYKDNEWFTL